jgi:phosphopentomutase
MARKKVILVVLDSVGVGAMPDAADFLDEGSNTLANTAAAVGGLSLPHMERLGLGNIIPVAGVSPVASPLALVGKMGEASPAKDTVTGHWELAGHVSTRPFATFPDGFPPEIMVPFEARSGFSTLVNKPYSGTDVLDDFGVRHMESGALIVYTSADSVFQVAAHEEVVPLAELYRACEVARTILDDHHLARVIARPFVGEPGAFQRTYNRKDFCMEPPGPTLLDLLTAAGKPVYGVGKIHDIFAGRGVTENLHTEGNRDGLEQTLALHRRVSEGLIFVNLVDFDMLYGHRRNPAGYAEALVESDRYLGTLLAELGDEDAVILTADHGCDPTHAGHTDHTREYVPFLLYGKGLPSGPLPDIRSSFADLAATVAALMGIPYDLAGRSVLEA